MSMKKPSSLPRAKRGGSPIASRLLVLGLGLSLLAASGYFLFTARRAFTRALHFAAVPEPDQAQRRTALPALIAEGHGAAASTAAGAAIQLPPQLGDTLTVQPGNTEPSSQVLSALDSRLQMPTDEERSFWLPSLLPPIDSPRPDASDATLLPGGAPAAAPRQPEQVVREFYDAMASQNCSRALELRPGYEMSKCRNISHIEIYQVELKESDARRAVVYLAMSYTLETANGPEQQGFLGHLMLTPTRGQWQIVNGSYRSLREHSLDRYLREIANPPPAAARQPAQPMPPRTSSLAEPLPFRPPTLLEHLWTLQELRGTPHDTRIVRLRVPEAGPPAQSLAPPPVPVALRGAIRWVKPVRNRPVVALTFDLCERADEVTGYDAPIVNYLRAEKVRATFFAGGKWMQSHAEKTMQLMADPLFEVGNHGWTHENLRVLTGESLVNQIRWTQDQYALLWEALKHRALHRGLTPHVVEQEMARIPSVPLTFRFPYGTCSPEALHALATHGLQAIQWDVVSGDPALGQTAHEITQTVLRHTKPGSIVIFHANGRGHGTAAALPHIIPALRTRGFAFVTVSELLSLGEGTFAPEECYELRPGDNWRYDALTRKGASR